MSQCNDDGLQIQRKYKQRQQQLLQSYKHCKRRRIIQPKMSHVKTTPILSMICTFFSSTCSVIRSDDLFYIVRGYGRSSTAKKTSTPGKRHWMIGCSLKIPMIVVVLVAFATCLITHCRPIEATIIKNTNSQGLQSLAVSSLLSKAKSSQRSSDSSTILSTSSPPSTPKQQRQLQQQQLFALLKLNGMPTSGSEGESLSSSAMKHLKNKHHPYNHLIDDIEEDNGDDEDVLYENNSVNLTASRVLETTGYVSDDGQQYEKADKNLAAATAGGANNQQTQILANNLNCPKECKCLNDYFDCSKKHLDHVPALPNYVQVM